MNPKDANCFVCYSRFDHTDDRVYYDSITARYICKNCWSRFR